MERFVVMSDGSKLLQTLVNTENVEKRLASNSLQGSHSQDRFNGDLKSERTDALENDLN